MCLFITKQLELSDSSILVSLRDLNHTMYFPNYFHNLFKKLATRKSDNTNLCDTLIKFVF